MGKKVIKAKPIDAAKTEPDNKLKVLEEYLKADVLGFCGPIRDGSDIISEGISPRLAAF